MDDFEIARLGRVRVVAIEKLEHLSVGDLGGRPRHDLHDPHVADRHHHLERPRIEGISDQHRRFVAEQSVGGAASSPELRIVHDVVVKEGRGMDELDDHCELDMPVAFVTQRAGGEQNQQRPQPLAAAADDVLGNLVHEDDVGCQALTNGAIDGREIVVDEPPNRGKVDRRRRRRDGKHGRCHRQPLQRP